jgi:hypothetical protein
MLCIDNTRLSINSLGFEPLNPIERISNLFVKSNFMVGILFQRYLIVFPEFLDSYLSVFL